MARLLTPICERYCTLPVGNAIGNSDLEAEGKNEKLAGKVQKKIGEIKKIVGK